MMPLEDSFFRNCFIFIAVNFWMLAVFAANEFVEKLPAINLSLMGRWSFFADAQVREGFQLSRIIFSSLQNIFICY